MKIVYSIVSSLLVASSCGAGESEKTYDLVIYGGTSAGVIAAVKAKQLGMSVIIVCPDNHLGGLSSGGLGQTDVGRGGRAVGGLARGFYQDVWNHYQDKSSWKKQSLETFSKMNRKRVDAESKMMMAFEPKVAEGIFESYIEEHSITVKRDRWLDLQQGVRKEGEKIVSIKMLNGEIYKGKQFMDVSYEGDLMAKAGVSYAVGREPNSMYREKLNGSQVKRAVFHQFAKGVDPYVIKGDPKSGLLKGIEPSNGLSEGEGDKRIQAYNFRMCLTNDPSNRVPFAKPDGYDEKDYELLFRNFEAGENRIPLLTGHVPNKKTDSNNSRGVSTDFIGGNYGYPEAGYEERKKIIAAHEKWQKGLMWTLANHERVPEGIRLRVRGWGLAKDEFVDNGHWPHQIYVREARRMVSDFVMTESYCRRKKSCPKPIGLGSYMMDSHHVRRYVDSHGHVRNEGDVQVHPGGMYQIDYGCVIPKRKECTNLFVPVCVSSSHIAFGSIRMEPVFMLLGESATCAAYLANKKDLAVQDVDYGELVELLQEAGQRLEVK